MLLPAPYALQKKACSGLSNLDTFKQALFLTPAMQKN